jgi:hypothetical protein
VQKCYERWDPATPPGMELPAAAEVPPDRDEVETSGLFDPPRFRRYEWEQTYSTTAYLDLLRSYSGHRHLEKTRRDGLLACVAGLIDKHHDGQVTKRYLNELRVARRSEAKEGPRQ